MEFSFRAFFLVIGFLHFILGSIEQQEAAMMIMSTIKKCFKIKMKSSKIAFIFVAF